MLYISAVKYFYFTGVKYMDIVKTDHYNRLYDLYGDLLTDKQRRIFEMYFADDLSLAEIAFDQNVSRQAVKYCLDNCIKTLNRYENTLKFGEKVSKIEKLITNQPDSNTKTIAKILGITIETNKGDK